MLEPMGAWCAMRVFGASCQTMRENKINYNKILRSNTYLYDCGSIYTLSAQPNSEVAYNYIVNQVLLYGSLYHDARSGTCTSMRMRRSAYRPIPQLQVGLP
jgi:hypothetical protein